MKRIILFTLILSSALIIIIFWKPILLKISGYEKPKVEKPEDIKKYMDDEEYDILGIASSENAYYFLQKTMGGFPSVAFLDKNFNTIKSARGVGCPKVAKSFVYSLDKNKNYDLEKNVNIPLLNVLNSMYILDSDDQRILKDIKEHDFDYIIMYTWGKALKSQSKQMIEIGTDANQINDIKIIVISINLDYSSLWMKENDLIIEIY